MQLHACCHQFLLNFQHRPFGHIFIILILIRMSKVNIDLYKSFRVYRSLSSANLLNHILCNRIMKLPIIVNNARVIYNISNKILGKTITHSLVGSTFCKVFTAGNTLQSTFQFAKLYRSQNVLTALQFCAEGEIAKLQNESILDDNAKLFAQSLQNMLNVEYGMVSVKISALINMDLLRKYNNSVLLINKLWNEHNVNGKMTYESLFTGIRKLYAGVSEDQIDQYLKCIHSHTNKPFIQFSASEFDFKTNHHPFYLFDESKSQNFIVKLFFPLDKDERQMIKGLQKRLNLILGQLQNNSKKTRVLVDAQQTYIQKGVQSISQQLQEKYNKSQPCIFPTIQNYLKTAPQRVKYQIFIAQKRDLFFCAKLVRGAYIVEETRLSKQNQYESPIVSNFDETTKNYLGNFKEIITNISKGQAFVATHNENTIMQVMTILKANPPQIRINFAQLLGLADHLTIRLSKSKYPVYKLLPWAEAQVMVPYMIRRAEQLNQMRYPIDIQYTLLKNELWNRFIGK